MRHQTHHACIKLWLVQLVRCSFSSGVNLRLGNRRFGTAGTVNFGRIHILGKHLFLVATKTGIC